MGRICTINVPQSYITAMRKLTDTRIYESRSEVVRKAIYEEMIEILQSTPKPKPKIEKDPNGEEKIFLGYSDKNEPMYQTFKVLKKLD